jgi:hypothetical protein
MESDMTGMRMSVRVAMAVFLLAGAVITGCDKSPKYDTNLLKNASFEDVGRDGIPKHWKLVLFRGAPDQPGVIYGIDTLAVDGEKSWTFSCDPGTRRWYFLQQEKKIVGATHVRVKGWILGDDVRMQPSQFAMCNFLLTFFDKDHHRFQVERQADRRTPLRPGTYPWEEQVYTFAVPEGTHYIAFSCLLSMSGQAWFDNVSMEIPKPVDWETETTKNYVFHWLPGHPFPANAIQEQQARFDEAAAILGVKSDVVINYYLYPDSATIQKMIGLKRSDMYVSWDDYDFHTIRPSDDHEVVHFITDSIGRPPRSIAEGTVIWMQNRWGHKTLDEQLSLLVRDNQIMPFAEMFEYNRFVVKDPNIAVPMAGAFVKFVVEKWGNAKLMELYRAVNGLNNYEAVANAFESVYGIPMNNAENGFRIWLFSNYGR